MSRLWDKMWLYLSLPEMRLFWYFLPLILIILAIEVFYLPSIWVMASAGVFILMAAIILVNNLRLARLNLEMKVERNELSSIILNLTSGVIAYDQNFKILIFNKAAQQIFGVNEGDVIGEYFSPEKISNSKFTLLCQILFPSLAPAMVRRTPEGVYPQTADFSFNDPMVELRITTDKIVDSNGRLLGFVKIVQDRTRETQMLKSKSEFIEVAAHQLRTPLTSINWIFESLLKEKLIGEQKEMVDMGAQAAGNVLKTVNDLLDASQIEGGKFGYKFESKDIVSFIEEIMGEILPFAKESGIKLYFKRPPEPLPAVLIDSRRLSIAFSNLVVNAIKYNVENGEVIVEVKKVDKKPYIQISVKDTGIGIPPSEINKLFTKFFRADNAQKQVANGTGLGLYIVKNIIKRHGGEIWLESQLNRGSTFIFTLPTDPELVPSKEIAFSEE